MARRTEAIEEDAVHVCVEKGKKARVEVESLSGGELQFEDAEPDAQADILEGGGNAPSATRIVHIVGDHVSVRTGASRRRRRHDVTPGNARTQ